MDKIQPYIAQAAEIIRGLLAQVPQAKSIADQLPDAALVGAAAGAALVALILLITIVNVIGGLFKPKKAREEEPPVRREPVREARREPPQREKPRKAADPVEKIQREASAGAARARQEVTELQALLTRERARAAAGEANFAVALPNEALRLAAEGLVDAREPAQVAARRKVASGDFDGARADLRRHAETAKSADAWRDLATLEALKQLEPALAGFETARKLDGREFVSLVTLRRLYSGLNRPDEARDAANSAVAAARTDRERAIALDELGDVCMIARDGAGAKQAYEQSLSIVRGLLDRNPRDNERLRDLAVGHYKLANLGLDVPQNLNGAIAAFEKIKAAGALARDDEQALGQLKTALAEMQKKQA
jgi:hypothetical protein